MCDPPFEPQLWSECRLVIGNDDFLGHHLDPVNRTTTFATETAQKETGARHDGEIILICTHTSLDFVSSY
jgi:hypothetical protein